MNEELLQYIWKFRLFDAEGLQTLDGENVGVVKTGEQNYNSGADFSNALLKIGELLWAGNVEIETQSANWQKHGHHADASHQNTLVLVCLYHNAANPISIPIIELKGRINDKLLDTYRQMMEEQAFIPCQKFIARADTFTLHSWQMRLLAERLEQKVQPVLQQLQNNKNNWEETFYQVLGRNFGFNTNALPFELLVKNTSLAILVKHKNSLLHIEALLLGQAGFLQNIENPDEYCQKLQTEYTFLAKKYRLTPLHTSVWKFSKIRPASFPTLRIAQFAALVHTSTHLFSKIIENPKTHALQKLLSIKASHYWDTHYHLGIATKRGVNSLGEEATNNILINTIAPFLFAYGIQQDNESYRFRAIGLLEALPKENNRIIRGFEALAILPANAAETQALLQLHKHWCTPKKCLQCRIGHTVLSR